jgi:uncharacterized membrane protein (DUF441 family)
VVLDLCDKLCSSLQLKARFTSQKNLIALAIGLTSAYLAVSAIAKGYALLNKTPEFGLEILLSTWWYDDSL